MATVTRQVLLDAGETFVRKILLVNGVERIALVGSITTDKSEPKDIDFLLTVSVDIDMKAAATEGRTAYYPQTTPYNINDFPAARNQHTKAVKQHTLAT